MTICVTRGDKNSLRKLVSDADISAASLGRSLGRLHSVEHTLEENNRESTLGKLLAHMKERCCLLAFSFWQVYFHTSALRNGQFQEAERI